MTVKPISELKADLPAGAELSEIDQLRLVNENMRRLLREVTDELAYQLELRNKRDYPHYHVEGLPIIAEARAAIGEED